MIIFMEIQVSEYFYTNLLLPSTVPVIRCEMDWCPIRIMKLVIVYFPNENTCTHVVLSYLVHGPSIVIGLDSFFSKNRQVFKEDVLLSLITFISRVLEGNYNYRYYFYVICCKPGCKSFSVRTKIFGSFNDL
jgi:hypothetical protein